MSDRQSPTRTAQIRGLCLTKDVKNGKERRDGGVSKNTNEYLGLSECPVEKQVYKRRITLSTAIMLSFISLG